MEILIETAGIKVHSPEEARVDESMGFLTPKELDQVEIAFRLKELANKAVATINAKLQKNNS